jgi:exonuclease SbcD
VAVAHAFVVGGAVSESERPLSVGGSGAVAADVFHGFDFVALGHLHRPQCIGDRMHYSGSLLKYSLSEAEHIKTVSLIELDAEGGVRIEAIPLRPLRDLRVLTGTLAGLRGGRHRPAPGRLRPCGADRRGRVAGPDGAIAPGLSERTGDRARGAGAQRSGRGSGAQAAGTGYGQPVREFFREVADTDLDGDQRRALDDLLAVMQASERESA